MTTSRMKYRQAASPFVRMPSAKPVQFSPVSTWKIVMNERNRQVVPRLIAHPSQPAVSPPPYSAQ